MILEDILKQFNNYNTFVRAKL